MEFTLRPVELTDGADLQALYEDAPTVFRELIGRPAAANQAANDLAQAATTPGRYQYAVQLDGRLVGLADCKLDDAIAGLAHIGLLLLRPPYDDPAIRGLTARMLARWLAELGAQQVAVGVPAHAAAETRFWQALGFEFTGEQYRRNLPGFAPRYLILQRDVAGLAA